MQQKVAAYPVATSEVLQAVSTTRIRAHIYQQCVCKDVCIGMIIPTHLCIQKVWNLSVCTA